MDSGLNVGPCFLYFQPLHFSLCHSVGFVVVPGEVGSILVRENLLVNTVIVFYHLLRFAVSDGISSLT